MDKIRLGITTRVAEAEGYSEPRDCLAQDWANFFKTTLPEVDWMMLPNTGSTITDYVQRWELNAFIISGGNDLGENQLREDTENTLIDYAVERSLPLLGVCRGLQLLCSHFGGRLERAAPQEHPVKPHTVTYLEPPFGSPLPAPAQVNSYHNWLIKDSGSLKPFITDQDSNIEGVYHAKFPLIGIGWHPERTSPSADFDRSLIRKLFLKEL